MSSLAIGIDTGGTYTDAVLMDYDQGRILATKKALTTRHDLAIGILDALRGILPANTEEICLVSLSTTLATNAIVEGRGAPVCTLLIGYEPIVTPGEPLASLLGTPRYALIGGGHTIDGEERQPLDLAAAAEAIRQHAPHVQAFAISGYFGTRNPAHEQAVQRLVAELTSLPSTCGHELTQQLDALRRATTVTLNAKLIPLLRDLIMAVQASLHALGVEAPLMLVKGDGSLMQAEVAMQRPIETILSGPAASVVGACYLSEARDAVIVDMGGTTTDIAFVRDAMPLLNTQGAEVGGWRTMVEAIDVHTVGLGGDSHVWLDREARIRVGPQRVVPLSLLAAQYPAVEEQLAALAAQSDIAPEDAEFILLQRPDWLQEDAPPPFEEELLAALSRGPLSWQAVCEVVRYPMLYQPYLVRLEREGVVARAGLTPTDAAHVLGRYTAWNRQAARYGAEILARALNMAPESLCEQILLKTSYQIAKEIVCALWKQNGNGAEPIPPRLLDQIVGAEGDDVLRLRALLKPKLVAIGAPVATYFERVAQSLHGALAIPPHHAVANAVGAVVGSVVGRVQARIVPQENEQGYYVQLPTGTKAFSELVDALAYARAAAEELACAQAYRAGAQEVRIRVDEKHHYAPVSEPYGGELYISTSIEAQAVGRPRLGR